VWSRRERAQSDDLVDRPGSVRKDHRKDIAEGAKVKRSIAVLLLVALVGCVGLLAAAEPLKIGITKIVEHPALDAVEQGVIDALAAAGYEEGVDVEYLLTSAQGEMANAIAIAQNYLAQNVDLVVAIATPSAQAAVDVFRGTEVPVIYGAVTDPVEAAKLVPSATDPSGNENVTGVSDMIPVAAHLRLLKNLSPEIAKVGIVYNPGEANSAILTEMALAAAPDIGLEIVTATADTTANVPLAAQSLVGRVDAYYVTTDNTVVSAIDSVLAASEEAGVPFLVADPTSLEHATLAAGFDYYDLGLTVGRVVLDVLSGVGTDEIPVTYVTEGQIHLNLDLAAGIGFEFPAAIIDQASAVLYGGVVWEKQNP
jgi:putative ABC transport system substrate-binding protein